MKYTFPDIVYAVDIIYEMTKDGPYSAGWKKFEDKEHGRLVSNVATVLAHAADYDGRPSPLIKSGRKRGFATWEWKGMAPTKEFYKRVLQLYSAYQKKKNHGNNNSGVTAEEPKQPIPIQTENVDPFTELLRECKRLGIVSLEETSEGVYEGWFRRKIE